MPATLIIPGFMGSEAGHWQRHWLESDPSSTLVEQDDWDYPVLSEWLYNLEAYLEHNPGAILVAHSLGCILVAQLSRRLSAAHIGGALLVAPADSEAMTKADPRFESFAPINREPLPFPTIVVASHNDPYMSFAKAKALADVWGAGFIDLGKAGHINPDSGYSQFPEGQILAGNLQKAHLVVNI